MNQEVQLICTALHMQVLTYKYTHTRSLNDPLSGTTKVGRYWKKHSPTHTHCDHYILYVTNIKASLINFD